MSDLYTLAGMASRNPKAIGSYVISRIIFTKGLTSCTNGESNLTELETKGSKRIRLETTTATIAGAGIYIPRALVTDNLMSRLNDEALNAAFQ
jgi:hypothetical protein